MSRGLRPLHKVPAGPRGLWGAGPGAAAPGRGPWAAPAAGPALPCPALPSPSRAPSPPRPQTPVPTPATPLRPPPAPGPRVLLRRPWMADQCLCLCALLTARPCCLPRAQRRPQSWPHLGAGCPERTNQGPESKCAEHPGEPLQIHARPPAWLGPPGTPSRAPCAWACLRAPDRPPRTPEPQNLQGARRGRGRRTGGGGPGSQPRGVGATPGVSDTRRAWGLWLHPDARPPSRFSAPTGSGRFDVFGGARVGVSGLTLTWPVTCGTVPELSGVAKASALPSHRPRSPLSPQQPHSPPLHPRFGQEP